jgi:hypothetical protein
MTENPVMNSTIRTGLFLVLCALPAASQNSASLSETTNSIKLDLSGVACLSFAIGPSQGQLQRSIEGAEGMFSECEMRLVTSLTEGNTGTMGDFKVHLGKLDPSRIEITEGVRVPTGWLRFGVAPEAGITLVTAGDEKVIEAVNESFGVGESKPTTSQVSEIHIRIRDRESAEKLAAEFSRAITMCGGKPVAR